jgi:two-component system, LytTR family, response regulator
MTIRALIVDDEPPARDLISTLLRDEPDLEVVGQCANGRDAVAAIKRHSPDLVFLDVQMPGMDGFAVLAELTADRLPLVIFVTAFDQHAIRAFEVHALDYLLKPFEYDRLRQAVRHARTQLAQGPATAGQTRLISLLEELHNRGQSWNRLAIRDAGRILFLQPDEIDWIEAEGNYVRLHVGKESHLLRETMNATEERLASKNFLRVNRSTIVNLERVTEWQPLFHGDSVVILRDGTRLTVSRGYRQSLDRLVAQLR